MSGKIDLGGFPLLRYGYNVLDIGLGVAGILSSMVIYMFAIDPTRK
jgi:hypothetical protein